MNPIREHRFDQMKSPSWRRILVLSLAGTLCSACGARSQMNRGNEPPPVTAQRPDSAADAAAKRPVTPVVIPPSPVEVQAAPVVVMTTPAVVPETLVVITERPVGNAGSVSTRSESSDFNQSASVFGRITKTAGVDTVSVAGALVSIRDLRLTVQSDADGFYEFRTGLVPGRYRVFAEFDGVKGSTARPVPVTIGENTKVPIHLGGMTPWPPPLALDTLSVKAGRRGKIRG